jgi:hypothetical protein
MPIRIMMSAMLVLVSGCTTVHDLGGGRYIVPRVAEVRSPFGTNMGFVMLEACDGVPQDASWSSPLASGTQYMNCRGITEWEPLGSQGQGGQIVSGLLQAGGLLGLGALMPASTSSATLSTPGTGTPGTFSVPGGGLGGHVGKGH